MSNLAGRGYELELRFYSVSIRIVNPLKVFDLDIDIGSDLIWVQCDAPCTGCTKYKGFKNQETRNILVEVEIVQLGYCAAQIDYHAGTEH
ncbi:Aspartic proteinase Asp1, partial [Linum perenne]